jgi:hypothetical protein
MLHLMKLAVGVRDTPHLARLQAERSASEPPLRHYTRAFPRRAAEILAGGSIYWIIAGVMQVRQRILAIEEDREEDGTKTTALVLDPALVPVIARPTQAFQGWRYLTAEAAPPDLDATPAARGEPELPPHLRQVLRELCLL